MKISMYQASAPRFANMLRNLSAILDKAQAHGRREENRSARCPAACGSIADMFPLSRQVQIACDTAKGAVARLAGVEIPKHEDTEQTFAELKARIAKTLDFIESVPAAKVDGIGGASEVVLQDARGERQLQGHAVPARPRAIPNFYFHVTTAYNILRANGVELGKNDFIGTP